MQNHRQLLREDEEDDEIHKPYTKKRSEEIIESHFYAPHLYPKEDRELRNKKFLKKNEKNETNL